MRYLGCQDMGKGTNEMQLYMIDNLWVGILTTQTINKPVVHSIFSFKKL